MTLESAEDLFIVGFALEAPLPNASPAPHPPGMVELKTYRSVRRAEYSAKGPSTINVRTRFPSTGRRRQACPVRVPSPPI